MQDIILVGSGGCMREIVWQIQEQNKSAENWNILGYVDRMPPEEHSSVTVGDKTIKYIGNDDYFAGKNRIDKRGSLCGRAKASKKNCREIEK